MKIKKLTLFLFLIVISLHSQRAQHLISSYNKLLSKNKDSALAFTNHIISSNQTKEEKAYGYAGKAYVFTLRSKYAVADTLFKKSFSELHTVKNSNTEIQANIQLLFALHNIEQHQLPKAIHVLNDALQICDTKCAPILKIKLQSSLARAYSLSKKHQKALEISSISLKTIKSIADFNTNDDLKKEYIRELVKAANRSINLFLADKKRYTKYIDSTKKYVALANINANRYNIHNYKGSLFLLNADINFHQEKYNDAKKFYQKGLEIFKQKNYPKRVAQILFRIAECQYHANNFTAAEAIFLEQLHNNTWANFQLLDNEAKSYFYLFKIQEEKKNASKALEYANLYVEKLEKHLTNKNNTNLSVNDIVHKKSREKEIKGYIKNYTDQKHKNTIYRYLLIASIVIFSLVLLYFMYIRKENQKNIHLLTTRISELQIEISKDNLSKSSSLSDDNALALLTKLKSLEKEELFCKPNYTLNTIAKKLKTNSSYLSKTVNENLGITFAEYTNRLKINSIVSKLEHQKSYRNYTINALAQEAGYKSTNSFNSNFKKLLKVTPSQYLKELKKENLQTSSKI